MMARATREMLCVESATIGMPDASARLPHSVATPLGEALMRRVFVAILERHAWRIRPGGAKSKRREALYGRDTL